MGRLPPLCSMCRFRDFDGRRKCSAFSKIPDDVYEMRTIHDKPIKGDHGFLFEIAGGIEPAIVEEILRSNKADDSRTAADSNTIAAS